MMNKDLLSWACWTAKTINVNGKNYCMGHIAVPDNSPVHPINKCLHCQEWIGNRRAIVNGNLVLHQNRQRVDENGL